MTCDRDFFTFWRRRDYGTKFLRSPADSILLILLKDCIELEAVHDAFSCESDDETAFVCTLDVVIFEQVSEQHLVVLLRYPVKVFQRQYL